MWYSAVGFVVTLTLSLLVAPLAAYAQPVGRTVTIGYLGNSSPSLESNLVEAFRDGLRQLGYVEGRNLIITYQWAEGYQERSAALAGRACATEAECHPHGRHAKHPCGQTSDPVNPYRRRDSWGPCGVRPRVKPRKAWR